METSYEKVKKTIELLLNRTTERGFTLAEAQAAFSKVQELATRYEIDVAKLDPRENLKVWVTFKKERVLWRQRLLIFNAVAGNNSVRLLVEGEDGSCWNSYTLFGLKRDVELVDYLFDAIDNCLYALGESIYQDERGLRAKNFKQGYTANFRKWFHDFYMGASGVICRRLRESKDLTVRQQNCQALMIMKDADLEKAFREAFPRTSQGKHWKDNIHSVKIYSQGQEVGRELEIHRAIDG